MVSRVFLAAVTLGSQLPRHEDTQAALWSGPHGKQLTLHWHPANSPMSTPFQKPASNLKMNATGPKP